MSHFENLPDSSDPQAIIAQKTLKAMIETIVMSDPSLEVKLSVAAAWQYLQFPDSTFGWLPKDKDNAATPMPLQYKIACIIPTIIHRLQPGHIRWIGNGPYVMAEGWNEKFNSTVKKRSGQRWRDFTAEERKMFQIADSDMVAVIEQDVSIDGVDITISGYGVLGADEMKANQWGKHKVATQLTRDKMQFTRTRATRDMIRRNISISGLPDADDAVVDTVNVTPQSMTESFFDNKKAADKANAEAEAQEAKDDAMKRFGPVVFKFAALGGLFGQIFGMNADAFLHHATAEKIQDAIDIMDDWIKENTPPPEPPAKAEKPKAEPKPEAVKAAPVANAPTPQPAEKPRGRGRPPKVKEEKVETVAAAVTIISQGEVDIEEMDLSLDASPEPELVHPENEGLDEQTISAADAWLQDMGEANEELFDPDSVLDDVLEEEAETAPPVDPMTLIYQGTDEQKEMIRSAATAAGIMDEATKFAIAGALKNQPMNKLPTIIGGMLKLHGDKAKMIEKKPVETPKPITKPAETPMANPNKRIIDSIAVAEKFGGDIKIITGFAPEVLKNSKDTSLIWNAANKLDNWASLQSPSEVKQAPVVPKPSAATATIPKPTTPASSEALPEMPTVGPGAKSFEVVGKFFVHPNLKPITRARLVQLSKRKLTDGDYMGIIEGVRLCNAGNPKRLDEIIAARPLR